MNKDDAWLFVRQYTQGQYAAADHVRFMNWLFALPYAEQESLLIEFTAFLEEHLPMQRMAVAPAADTLFQRIEQQLINQPSVPVVIPAGSSRRAMRWVGRVAAAIVIAVALVFGYFQLFRQGSSTPEVVELVAAEDVQPGGDRALLILGDGRRIALDSVGNGELARQEGTQLLKLADGQLTYTPLTEGTSNLYNVVTTPRGGQYRIVLPDGSRVWLNAASLLRFPTAFRGGQRQVELQGEAYFEVVEGGGQPFEVVVSRAGEMDSARVRVTEGPKAVAFNLSSYREEPEITATLLNGKMQVGKGKEYRSLVTGQQAKVEGERIVLQSSVDTSGVTAWRWGMFQFTSSPIEPVMRQLSRWYDVEVIYEGRVTDRFNARIARSVPLSKVLNLLEQTNAVHFTIRDRTVVVRR